MSEQPLRGISRKGLDAAFDGEEERKSNLFLEAKYLLALRKFDEAAIKLAEGAQIEENLAAICEAKRLMEKAWVHHFSAVCGWAQAGNLYAAITLGDNLLARADLPDPLRQRVQEFVESLRRRRVQWAEEGELATTGVEG